MQYNKTDEQTHNGWRNRETWLVHLWLSHEQSTVDQVHEIIAQVDDDVYQQGQAIREFVEEFSPLAEEASLYCDLLNDALSSVDWMEIATAFAETD